ncbi:hypothetical protein [Paenibacillus sp.]|uniref:hypothetical protein n=1 Tax=Paenibacillus sp. TaxID=58172 RepID=UPI0034638C36
MVIIEKIIHFITSNPLIAIFILGAILSSLGGSKKKDGKNRMPDFSGGTRGSEDKKYNEDLEEEYKEVEHQPAYASADKSSPIVLTSSSDISRDTIDSDEARLAEMEQRLAAIDRMASSISSGAGVKKGSASAAVSSVSKQGIPSREITSDEVMQGVIWSEILGPPRAKRPYNQRQR